MEKQLSDLWSLNRREWFKSFVLALLGALLGLLWSGLNPVINEFVKSFTIDFTPFFAAVNFETAYKVSMAACAPYLMFTFSSGNKKE